MVDPLSKMWHYGDFDWYPSTDARSVPALLVCNKSRNSTMQSRVSTTKQRNGEVILNFVEMSYFSTKLPPASLNWECAVANFSSLFAGDTSLLNCQTKAPLYWHFSPTQPKLSPSTGRTPRRWSRSCRDPRYPSLNNWCGRYAIFVKVSGTFRCLTFWFTGSVRHAQLVQGQGPVFAQQPANAPKGLLV